MIEGHRQGRYDAQGNVQKGVVGWCGCVFFCSVGVVVFSAGAHYHGGLDQSLQMMRYFGPWPGQSQLKNCCDIDKLHL